MNRAPSRTRYAIIVAQAIRDLRPLNAHTLGIPHTALSDIARRLWMERAFIPSPAATVWAQSVLNRRRRGHRRVMKKSPKET